MLEQLTLLLAGFSLVAAAILFASYVFAFKDVHRSAASILTCACLLAALAGLQLHHVHYLQSDTDPFGANWYVVLLLLAPVSFYFFSREILMPERAWSPFDVGHAAPLLLSLALPPSVAAPMAFVVGAAYSVWFAYVVHGMRRQRSRFRYEMFFFSLFAVLAVATLVLVLLVPYIDNRLFFLVYANAISLAMVLVVAALLSFPDLATDIAEAGRMTYATSTLNDVDIAAVAARLEHVMQHEKAYQNENLNLSALALTVDLAPHQLSELINTHFAVGFSRFVRQYRIAEAKRILATDATASVLSISLATGFRSQSNFYAAFREMTGEAPGSYRKRVQSTPEAS